MNRYMVRLFLYETHIKCFVGFGQTSLREGLRLLCFRDRIRKRLDICLKVWSRLLEHGIYYGEQTCLEKSKHHDKKKPGSRGRLGLFMGHSLRAVGFSSRDRTYILVLSSLSSFECFVLSGRSPEFRLQGERS